MIADRKVTHHIELELQKRAEFEAMRKKVSFLSICSAVADSGQSEMSLRHLAEAILPGEGNTVNGKAVAIIEITNAQALGYLFDPYAGDFSRSHIYSSLTDAGRYLVMTSRTGAIARSLLDEIDAMGARS